ncbi:coiled-coil domain-containing protein [Stieleria varia]|nr:hypothetical protein [Stieleria varia]
MQADQEAAYLVAEKGGYFDNGSVRANPLSRLADPNSIDCPPIPPDDPKSHALMHCVDGKSGYDGWDKYGRVGHVENPDWIQALPINEQGVVELTMRDAVRVARLNSREYQTNLENLYLSALDVSFQRFRFDHQFFAGTGLQQVFRGRDVGATSPLAVNSFAGAQRLTATGGEIVVGFANSLIWDFWGTDSDLFTSSIDFSIIQPLLRNGGRARVLEQLTQEERNLLANVRQMEQFRQGFFVETVSGRDSGPGPSTGNNVGQAGLGLIAGAPSGLSGAPSAGGYLGLLQDQQEIRNRVANIAALRDSLAQLEAAFDANRINSRLQVDQARQALLNAQSSLLTANAAYQTRLDAYKVALGLPPQLELVVQDTLLDEFVLIDPDLTEIQNELENVLSLIRMQRENPQTELLDQAQAKLREFADPIREQIEIAQDDMSILDRSLMRRAQQLERVREKVEKIGADVDRRVYDKQRLAENNKLLKTRLPDVSNALASVLQEIESEYVPSPAQVTENELPEPIIEAEGADGERNESDAVDGDQIDASNAPDTPLRARWKSLSGLATNLSDLLLELSLVRAEVRLQDISIDDTEIESDEAIEIARVHRLDWMNARANLVDVYRKIEFTADQLESDLDVVIDGQLGTKPDNVLKFDSDRSRLRFGIQFDTPTARLAERNDYRVALLNYQRARRDYILFSDRVAQSIRNTLRVIALSEINLEVRRTAVQVAIAQVDIARLKLNPPPKDARVGGTSPTAARDLVSALTDLLDAQNDFLNVWVANKVLRMVLDFEMGTMQLDPVGMWIDPSGESSQSGTESGTESGTDLMLENLVPGLPEADDGDGDGGGTDDEDLALDRPQSGLMGDLRSLIDAQSGQLPQEPDFSQLLRDPQNLRDSD